MGMVSLVISRTVFIFSPVLLHLESGVTCSLTWVNVGSVPVLCAGESALVSGCMMSTLEYVYKSFYLLWLKENSIKVSFMHGLPECDTAFC